MPNESVPVWRRKDWDWLRREYLERTPPAQRRAWIRVPCQVPTTCESATAADDQPWPAMVQNISLGGINFIVGHRFDSGALLKIDLQTCLRQLKGPLLVRVIHVSPHEEGQWSVGCAFAGELGEEGLRAFRAKRMRPLPPDKRAWVRFPCNLATSYHSMAEEDGPLPAKVLDSSAGGLGLLVNRPFENGTILSIELPCTGGHSSRTVLARVVHARGKQGSYWILGCAFTSQLTEEDLRSLNALPDPR